MKKFLVIMFMLLVSCDCTFAYQEVKYMNTGVPIRNVPTTDFGSNAPWLPHNSAALAQRSREIERYEAITESIRNQNNYNYNHNYNYNCNHNRNRNRNYNYNNNSNKISSVAMPAKAPEMSRFSKEYKISTPKTTTRNGIKYYN